MAHNDVEIEIQVKVEKLPLLLNFLQEKGTFISEKRQVDEYYSPAHKDYVRVRPVAEWIRLREAGGKSSINYKNWSFEKDGTSNNYCDEYETGVADIDKMRKIFKALDFRLLTKVDKVRKAWKYKDFEIAIDSVKNIGDFVEVEYSGADIDDPKKIIKEMIAFLKKVGCGKLEMDNSGYPFKLLFPKEVVYKIL